MTQHGRGEDKIGAFDWEDKRRDREHESEIWARGVAETEGSETKNLAEEQSTESSVKERQTQRRGWACSLYPGRLSCVRGAGPLCMEAKWERHRS